MAIVQFYNPTVGLRNFHMESIGSLPKLNSSKFEGVLSLKCY